MKVKQKIISLILSLTLIMGLATAPAFALSDPDTSYFVNNQSFLWSGASGSHSLSIGTKLGDLVAQGINYLSLDLAALNSGINQIYTLVNTGLGTVSSNSTDIKNYLNNLNSGWWSDGTAPSGMTLSWYYQMLQAVKSGATDNTSIIYHLSNIYSSLNHWNGTSSESISDLVAGLGDYEEDIDSNTAISASNLGQLLQVVKKTNGKFFEYYTRANFPDGNFNDITVATSETYGAYHANGDGSYQISSLSGVADRLEFLAWLHSDLLNVMGMLQTPNSIYKTQYVNSDYTTTSAISLSLQDSIVLGNRVITKNQADTYNLLNSRYDKYLAYTFRHNSNDPKQSIYRGTYLPNRLPVIQSLDHFYSLSTYGTQSNLHLLDYLAILNSNMVNVATFIETIGTTYHASYITGEAITNQYEAFSLMDMLEGISYSVANGLSDLVYILADPESIQAKKDNAAQTAAVLDNFTGDGDASADASDFAGVKDSVSALKTSLSGGVSYTQAFNILGGDSDGWSWFSQEVADSMDSTNSTRGLLRGDLSYSTPYLDSYYDSIYSVLGIGGGVE